MLGSNFGKDHFGDCSISCYHALYNIVSPHHVNIVPPQAGLDSAIRTVLNSAYEVGLCGSWRLHWGL